LLGNDFQVSRVGSSFLIGSILLGLLVCWLNFSYQPLVRLDNLWLDQLVQARSERRPAADNIVIIDIDEASLQGMVPIAGRWPWPRALHAELLEYLLAEQPAAVVFDIVFAEPDIYRPDGDLYLSEVIASSNRVILPILHVATDADSAFPLLNQYPESLGARPRVKDASIPNANIVLPKAISPQAWRLGSINFKVDEDGIGRRYQLHYPIGEWLIPSVPARLVEVIHGQLPEQPQQFRIDWYQGGRNPYPSFPYLLVYDEFSKNGEFRGAGFFKDKIIFIGATAAGLNDIQATPLSATYPGIMILAAAADNALTETYLKELSGQYQAFVLLSSWLLLVMGLLGFRRLAVQLLWLLLIISLLFGESYRQGISGQLFPVLSNLLIIGVFTVAFFLRQYLLKQREFRHTVDIFGRFMDPHIVKGLVEQGLTEQLMEGKTATVTVLFSDIRGFTTLSEQRPAKEVVAILNAYLERQLAVIFRHNGTLDKFIGDAIMAFWGEPVDNPRQRQDAIQAAREMVDELISFRDEYGLPEFDIGIGIHTGTVVVGAIGAEKRYDYTAIGDTVNLASRIEGLTKQLGHRVLISRDSIYGCESDFDFSEVGNYTVKGRGKPVSLFTIRGETS